MILTSCDIQVRDEIFGKQNLIDLQARNIHSSKNGWNFSWLPRLWGVSTFHPWKTLVGKGVPGSYMSHKKKHLLLAMKSWLFNRGCYNDFLLSSHNWVGFHPAWTIALELPDIFVYLRRFVSSSPAILLCWICRSPSNNLTNFLSLLKYVCKWTWSILKHVILVKPP